MVSESTSMKTVPLYQPQHSGTITIQKVTGMYQKIQKGDRKVSKDSKRWQKMISWSFWFVYRPLSWREGIKEGFVQLCQQIVNNLSACVSTLFPTIPIRSMATNPDPSDPRMANGGVNLYHERQSRQLCALHALNNLLQGRIFTQKELDSICYEYVAPWLINLINYWLIKNSLSIKVLI